MAEADGEQKDAPTNGDRGGRPRPPPVPPERPATFRNGLVVGVGATLALGTVLLTGILIGRNARRADSSTSPPVTAIAAPSPSRAVATPSASAVPSTSAKIGTPPSTVATPPGTTGTPASPPTTSIRQGLDQVALDEGASDSSRVADTPYGPFGTVLAGGVTELYHYRDGTWESVGRFDSPTGVDAMKVDTLDVTQDGIYELVITMNDVGAMRQIGGVLVQRSDGGWYWADFQDPVDASYTPVRDGLRVLDGALVSIERACNPDCASGGEITYGWNTFNGELGFFLVT